MSSIRVEDLEQIYDHLAESIDSIEPEKRELFLVKLALLSANSLNDKSTFIHLITQAKVFEN